MVHLVLRSTVPVTTWYIVNSVSFFHSCRHLAFARWKGRLPCFEIFCVSGHLKHFSYIILHLYLLDSNIHNISSMLLCKSVILMILALVRVVTLLWLVHNIFPYFACSYPFIYACLLACSLLMFICDKIQISVDKILTFAELVYKTIIYIVVLQSTLNWRNQTGQHKWALRFYVNLYIFRFSSNCFPLMCAVFIFDHFVRRVVIHHIRIYH